MIKPPYTPSLPKANRSIRRYLLSSIFAIIVIGWSASAALNFLDAKEQVAELFDAELAQMSRVLQSLIIANRRNNQPFITTSDQNAALPYFDQEVLAQHFDDEEFNDSGHEYERKIAFQIWSINGQLILANHIAIPQQFDSLASGYGSLQTEGVSWRSFTLNDRDNGMIVRVAQRADVRDELTQEIAMHNIVPGLLITPLILLICGFAIRRGLNPLTDISTQLKNRDYNTLSPLSSSDTPQELQQLVSELNQLFLRVSESYQREKRFTSDAAHELRTPLSIAKVHLQNVQQVSKDETVQAYVEKALKGIERLIHLVSQLLTLSRLESVETRLNDALLLNSLLNDIQSELSELPENKSITVNKRYTEKVNLHGSETELRILLRNLFDNAFRYADKNSDIDVSLNPHELRIFNQCAPGNLITGSTESLFERFKRGTQTQAEGSGLGLAICQQICERYGYQLTLTVLQEGDTQGIETKLVF